ncbi:MAG TPA: sigma-70 family RNA polymerase sigma factor [Acidimicrobiales bacterium]|nr:sigma-70 family RNA polymerase sigma factor [Acidimicrobiales bacterium]
MNLAVQPATRSASGQGRPEDDVTGALLSAHTSLAHALARRFARHRREVDELTQVAMIGLWNAARRFDPDRGAAFPTFAWRTITGELKRHRRDRGWTVRPPRSSQDAFLAVSAGVEELTHELHRSPTVAEIAVRTGLTEEAVVLGTEALRRGTTEPLSQEDGLGMDHDGRLAFDDPGFVQAFHRSELAELLDCLDQFERRTVYLRFFEDLAQSDIAKRLGCSQMHVSRTLARSLAKMRERSVPVGLAEAGDGLAGAAPLPVDRLRPSGASATGLSVDQLPENVSMPRVAGSLLE